MKPTMEQLQERMKDASAHLAALRERERSAKVRLEEVANRVTALGQQIDALKSV
jgi:chromosome segregation ATPase